MNKAVTKLLKQLAEAKNSTTRRVRHWVQLQQEHRLCAADTCTSLQQAPLPLAPCRHPCDSAAGMQDLAQAIRDTLVDQDGQAVCGPSKVPEVVQALGRAMCPLLQTVLQSAGPPQHGPDGLRQSLGPMLNAALQQYDTSWRQPSRLLDLDACSLLLACLSKHLQRCFHTPAMWQLLSSLQASGDARALLGQHPVCACCSLTYQTAMTWPTTSGNCDGCSSGRTPVTLTLCCPASAFATNISHHTQCNNSSRC